MIRLMRFVRWLLRRNRPVRYWKRDGSYVEIEDKR